MIEYPLNYYSLVYAHLATILPAFAIGTYIMIRRKGSTQHKFLGKIYLLLMLTTASIALFIPAFAGPRLLLNHFGLIHLLCILTIYTCPAAYIAIKKGETKKHRYLMIYLYVGGLIIAGFFTLMPGRFIGELLFNSKLLS